MATLGNLNTKVERKIRRKSKLAICNHWFIVSLSHHPVMVTFNSSTEEDL